MKIKALVIYPDNSIKIKKVAVKDYKIEINNETYTLTNNDIMLKSGFFGITRWAIFYKSNPVSITSEIDKLAENEKIQMLIHNSLIRQFLDVKNMDITTLLLMAVVGAIIGAFIGYQIHTSVSPAKTVIGNLIMARF